jgi:hypothetical protein
MVNIAKLGLPRNIFRIVTAENENCFQDLDWQHVE